MRNLLVNLAILASPPALAQTHHASAKKLSAPRAAAAQPEPSGPTVLFDTTDGRLTCRLFTKEAPVTSQRFLDLATGAADWTDPSGAVQHGKPFYDGTAVFGATTAITGGDRVGGDKGLAGPPVPIEKTPGLTFERDGLLGMRVANGQESSSRFAILSHGNFEQEGRMVIFGLCDHDSAARVAEMSHTLLAAQNLPPHPIAIDHIAVMKPGDPPPPVAAPTREDLVVPHVSQPMPTPLIGPDPTGPTATIDTTMGTLTCRLFKETPIATQNFIDLANGTKPYKNARTGATIRGKPYYNGLHFARVLPDFMVQQSDQPGDPKGDSDMGFHFDVENTPGLTFDRPGRLAYANAGPDTNQTEWFITELPVHYLDGHYTIFGQCDPASVAVVERIARTPRDAHNNPLQPVTIRSVRIQ